jgi:outer membrane protein TolC
VYKGGLTASYDVDIWGANRSAASAAQASLEAQKPAAAAANLTVASSVAAGYVTLLSLDEQLRVTQQTLKSREAFNGRSVSLKRVYLTPGADAGGFRAALNAGADPAAAHQIAQQENALSVLLGANPAR